MVERHEGHQGWTPSLTRWLRLRKGGLPNSQGEHQTRPLKLSTTTTCRHVGRHDQTTNLRRFSASDPHPSQNRFVNSQRMSGHFGSHPEKAPANLSPKVTKSVTKRDTYLTVEINHLEQKAPLDGAKSPTSPPKKEKICGRVLYSQTKELF
jgi:hypothetical protein